MLTPKSVTRQPSSFISHHVYYYSELFSSRQINNSVVIYIYCTMLYVIILLQTLKQSLIRPNTRTFERFSLCIM
ncbi:MAG: hypothetical protein IIT49_00315 [Clostridia bacterium]|nr:hypothetical protein [Clostridia bacterium]